MTSAQMFGLAHVQDNMLVHQTLDLQLTEGELAFSNDSEKAKNNSQFQ
ncbi:hypothetical protein [Paramagnetospirillum magnetotacticum]|nr:hypothetical protein [Paramagnetospirillum magnetotacticum]